MGLTNSILPNIEINANSIHELFEDKLIYHSGIKHQPYIVLYFGNKIKKECFQILSKIKTEEDGRHRTEASTTSALQEQRGCQITFYQSKILAIFDYTSRYAYNCDCLTPDSFGYMLNEKEFNENT